MTVPTTALQLGLQARPQDRLCANGSRLGLGALGRGPTPLAPGCRAAKAPARRATSTRSAPLLRPTASAPTASAEVAAAVATSNRLPRSALGMTEQAAEAVKAALGAGKLRQKLVLILPVNEKQERFLNIEPIDYPCSLQKEFDTCCALTTSIMQRVLGPDTKIVAKRIDDGGVEGEPCSVLFPEDKSFVAVVFPTADRLKQIQSYAQQAERPLLIVNPQWRNEGQVISDFGFGPWRKAADDFLNTFEPSYIHTEKRIGNPGTVNAATGMRFASGGVIRVRREYPGGYEAYAMAADGSSQLLATLPKEPSYQEMDQLITEGRKAKLPIFEIAQRVTYVFEDGSEAAERAMLPGGRTASAADAPQAAPEEEDAPLESLSDTDIEAMDASTLRRRLTKLGQPTSGKISKLRERLREARDTA